MPGAFGAACAQLCQPACRATRSPRKAPLMRNPLRSEGDMFRLLLYVIAVFGAIIAIIVIVRALR